MGKGKENNSEEFTPYKDMLKGNTPSYLDYDLHEKGQKFCYVYITSYGIAKVSETGNLLECCYSINRFSTLGAIDVNIQGNHFRCASGSIYQSQPREFVNHKSMSRNYLGASGILTLEEILTALLKDDVYTYSSVVVKKTLFNLIQKSCKLNSTEKELVEEIFRLWRKPIKSE